MAGDWIKMRTDLYRDPKVCLIADELMQPEGELARYVNQHLQRDMAVTRNVMRNVTVGALVTVWGVTRHRGKRDNDNLFIRGITLSVIDDIADVHGFGDAMASAGWARQTEEGVIFPNFFEELNTEPTQDQKAKNAERQRRYREKRNALRNVTVAPQSDIEKRREEKRREEYIKGVSKDTCSELCQGKASDPPSEYVFPTTGKDSKTWALPESKLSEYRDSFPGLDVESELRAARQWCRDNAGKRKTPRGMLAFLTRWLNRAQNTGRGSGTPKVPDGWKPSDLLKEDEP